MICDILFPTSFLPQNNDGEVDEFINMDMNEISELTNSSKNFLFRNGFFKINNNNAMLNKLSILRQDIDNLEY